RQAVLAAREAGDLPVIAQMTFSEDGQTLAGESPALVAQALVQMGVQVLGSNCSVGPAGILDAVSEMATAVGELVGDRGGDILLAARPTAGLPHRLENRFLYGAPPQYFGEYARRFVEAGVRLIGGCCGTTPAHIAAMRDALSGYLPPATQSSFALMAGPRALPFVEAPRAAVEAPGAVGAPPTRLRQEREAGRVFVRVWL